MTDNNYGATASSSSALLPAEQAFSVNSGAPIGRLHSAVTTPLGVANTVLRLGVPMALSFTVSFAMFALTVMGGRIKSEVGNQDYIGASALSATMANTVLVMALSAIYAISIFTSKKIGKLNDLKREIEVQYQSREQIITDDEESAVVSHAVTEQLKKINSKISSVLKTGSIIAFALAPVPTIILAYAEELLLLFKQSPLIAALSGSFLRPYALAVLPILLRMVLEQIFFSFKKTVPAMLIGLTTFAIGVFLADMFCFGRYSTPQRDLAGIAYGFLIEAYLITAAFILYLAKAKDFKELGFFKNFTSFTREDWKQIKKLLKIGGPIAIAMIMETASSLVIGLFAGMLGSNALTAYSFWAQFYFFIFIPLIAFGQVAGQEASRLRGDRNTQAGVIPFAKYSVLINTTVIAIPSVLVAAYPDLLKYVLTSQDISEEVMKDVRILMPIVSVGVINDIIKYTMLQLLRAMGNNVVPTGLVVLNTWLGVLFAYALGFHTPLGILGVGLGSTMGFVGAALSLLPTFLKAFKQPSWESAHEATPLLFGAERPVGNTALVYN